jgi:hypothetical protein
VSFKLEKPPGPPMTLGDMRAHGVHHLIAFCLNDACRHQALIDVSSYPPDTLVPWFRCSPRRGLAHVAERSFAGPGWLFGAFCAMV